MKWYLLPALLLHRPVRILVHAYRRRPLPVPRPDLLVLGTAQYDGNPSLQLVARLDHALELWRGDRAEHIYTLGGNLPGDRFTEAEVSRTYLIQHGVPEEQVTAVPQGNDTRSSFEAFLAEHQPRKSIIVTDPTHALRAELIAKQAGIDAVASPTHTSPTRFPDRSWWLALSHEVGGLAVVDASRVFGRPVGDRLETILRRLQSSLRPSRRTRHEVLDDNLD
ncbi:YdcF family protein [Corynebacterium sp. YIM 101645]|uniref:YdcF family protein n=1 Tax=Corynebacterium lemuris TaxID=1859292 RepID=A0ABT2FYM7_9CORY|nr:YdcF family protein [Corynebacterium lemuris]MCS5480114.1 YdcF family protein [Corynebacterium lemuris]